MGGRGRFNGQPFDAYNPQAITSGGYGPGPISNGSFSITPSFRHTAKHNTTTHPTIRY